MWYHVTSRPPICLDHIPQSEYIIQCQKVACISHYIPIHIPINHHVLWVNHRFHPTNLTTFWWPHKQLGSPNSQRPVPNHPATLLKQRGPATNQNIKKQAKLTAKHDETMPKPGFWSFRWMFFLFFQQKPSQHLGGTTLPQTKRPRRGSWAILKVPSNHFV